MLNSSVWETQQYFCSTCFWDETECSVYFPYLKTQFSAHLFSVILYLAVSLVFPSLSHTRTLPTPLFFFLMLHSFLFHQAIYYGQGVIDKLVLVWCIVHGIIHRCGFCVIKTAYRTGGHLSYWPFFCSCAALNCNAPCVEHSQCEKGFENWKYFQHPA